MTARDCWHKRVFSRHPRQGVTRTQVINGHLLSFVFGSSRSNLCSFEYLLIAMSTSSFHCLIPLEQVPTKLVSKGFSVSDFFCIFILKMTNK